MATSRSADKMMQDFGKRLGAVRIESGYKSASDFARELGVEGPAYRKYERGEANPSLDLLARIRNLTGKSLDFLLLGKCEPKTEPQTYTGGCHCGHVRYEATLALDPVVSCNCSICSKRGALLSFATPDSFKLLSGGDDLVDYQFNKHVIHHLFCRTCGTESFARGKRPDGQEMVAINVRCLDGVDLSALKLTPFDGRSK